MKCMRGKKIPQHVLFKPRFYMTFFLLSVSVLLVLRTQPQPPQKKKQKARLRCKSPKCCHSLAYVVEQSDAAFSALPLPGSSIKNNIACTVCVAPFSAQLSLNKSTRSLPVSSARTTAAGFFLLLLF